MHTCKMYTSMVADLLSFFVLEWGEILFFRIWYVRSV